MHSEELSLRGISVKGGPLTRPTLHRKFYFRNRANHPN